MAESRPSEPQQLQNQLNMYQNLFDSISQGIIYQDSQGRTLYANQAAARILGVPLDEILGSHSSADRWQAVNEDGSPCPDQELPVRQAIRTGQPVKDRIMGVLNRDAGETRWIEVSAYPQPDPDARSPLQAFAIFTDITERRQAGSALRQTLDKLRRSQEIALVGDWSWDLASDRFSASEEALRQLGFTSDSQPRFQDIVDCIHPDDRQKASEKLRAALQSGNPYLTEFRVHRRVTGELRHILSRGEIEMDTHHQAVRVFGINQDISESKKTEEALRRSEEKYRLIFNYSPLGLFYFDEEAVIIDCSENFCKILGSSRNKLIGLPLLSLPDKKMTAEVQKALAGAVGNYEDIYTVVTSGKKVPLRAVFAAAVKDGVNSGGIGIIEDISERRATEEALKESETRLRNLSDNLPGGMVYQLDFGDNDSDRRFSYVSAGVERLHGISAAAVMADPMALYGQIVAKDRQRMTENEVEALARFKPYTCEFRCRLPDGRLEWRMISAAPRRLPSGHVVWDGIEIDITERKELEAVLEKRMLALTRPIEEIEDISFHDLFNLPEIQRLQDEFARATSVASVITDPDGRPLTRPSQFTDLCNRIIRGTEKGLANCYRSDAVLGGQHTTGPIVRHCLSGGLWDAGASIVVGGHHVANWLIGQVRDESQTDEQMRAYAREIGADESAFMEAFNRVPAMSKKHFDQIAAMLFTLAGQLSAMAYQNFMQARFISERRQSENSLRQSEIRFRELVELAVDGILLGDHQGKIISANQVFCDMLGMTAEQVLGKHIGELPFDADNMREHPFRFDLLQQGQTVDMQRILIRPDGQRVYIDMRTKMMPDGTYQSIIRDNSQNRLVSEALRSTNELFSLFMHHSPIYTFIKEVSPTESRVLQASDNFVDMIGQSGRDIQGKTMKELFPADFAAKISADDWAVVQSGQVLRLEEELNGRFYTTIKFPIIQGDRTLLAGYTIDISERKQAEQEREKLQNQLLQAQKMESVGRLAGGVAHDFNNMLGVILGHTDLGLNKLEAGHAVVKNLDEIRKAAERSANLTKQLLAFARKQTIIPKVLDINATVEGMLHMLERLIGEDIDLIWRPGKNVLPVRIDPSQVDQVLANLCINSRDAVSGNGRITIESDTVVIDGEDLPAYPDAHKGEYVRLIVSDNGSGMDAETKSHLFEPFFTTKEVGRGTGLGMATVYGIIRQNDGFISVYSEPGQGTSIKVYFPCYREKPEAVLDREPVAAAEHGQATILLVEDEPAILEMTGLILEDLGYTVLTAANPVQAIEIARNYPQRIDLLITDVIMPEMNGRELTRNLLSLYPGLKRIFMSGYTAEVIAHHGVLEDGVHFIQKPFTIQELGAKISEVLSG